MTPELVSTKLVVDIEMPLLIRYFLNTFKLLIIPNFLYPPPPKKKVKLLVWFEHIKNKYCIRYITLLVDVDVIFFDSFKI